MTQRDKNYLRKFKKSGGYSLREFNRATVPMFLDKGLSTSDIENLLEVDRTTIWRIKKRYLKEGLEQALVDDKKAGQPKKYTTDYEAELAVLACGPAPEGRRRRTIRL